MSLVVELEAVGLTAEELLLAGELSGLAVPLRSALPLDIEDPEARELMLVAAARSLAGRGLLEVHDGQLSLSPALSEPIRLLGSASWGVLARVFADTGETSEVALVGARDSTVGLATAGMFDVELHEFSGRSVERVLNSVVRGAVEAGQRGTLVVGRRADDGEVLSETIAWQPHGDGVSVMTDAAAPHVSVDAFVAGALSLA